MKRKFLKILIMFTLTFSIIMSFNVFNMGNINNTVSASTISTNVNINESSDFNYCFSVIKDIKIIDLKLSNSCYRLRNEQINEIIIHHSAGENTSVEDIDRMHNENGWGGIGYNFYIRSDGTIYKGREIQYAGAHCIGKNDSSIGICLEGNFENHKPSNEQLSSLLSLTVNLSKEYNVSKVSPHRDNYATVCPGKYFPLDMFMQVYYNSINNN